MHEGIILTVKENQYKYDYECAWACLNAVTGDGQEGAPIRTPYVDDNGEVKYYTCGVLTKYDSLF